MKEKTICIVTPTDRTYYRAIPLAKEFLDKEHNVINVSGTLPDGTLEQIEVTAKTVKTLKNGKTDGLLEVVDLADNSVTFSELYQDGKLMDVTQHSAIKHTGSSTPAEQKEIPLYPGTVVKSGKGSRSFYVQGQEVAEETVSSNGTIVELLGNIPDGDVKEFGENGQVILEAVYRDNKLNGEMVRYKETGEILSRETYEDGVLHGTAYYYQYKASGKAWSECVYQHALLHGPRKVYYPSGTLKAEENFRHGKLRGERITYYKNGNTETKENYLDGKLTGERTLYFPEGGLWYRENYKAGRLDGDRAAYFADGTVRLEEFYVDGLREGLRKVYSPAGELLTSEEYHWGTLVHNTERKSK